MIKKDLVASKVSKFLVLAGMLFLIVSLGLILVSANSWQSQTTPTPQPEGDLEADGDVSAQHIWGPWNIRNPARHHEIEGYASLDSVVPGSSIGLDVSCIRPAKFKTDIFRMGYYGGQGALLVKQLGYRSCSHQGEIKTNRNTGLVDTNWNQTQHLIVSKTWQPGYYLARLTSNSGYQTYVPFVVRSPKVENKYLFVDSIATSAAYNNWGGNSLYVGYTPAARVHRGLEVSLNRPYTSNDGAGDFLNWEYPMIRYLERYGYNVDYTTDIQVNANLNLLRNYKAIIIAGHDEYWTWPMLNSYIAAVKSGINLAVFGANTDYRPSRIVADPTTRQKGRVVVCYKAYRLDPAYYSYLYNLRHNHPSLTLGRFGVTGFNWRSSPFDLPESELLGESFRGLTRSPGDLVVNDASSWIFAGTNLTTGDRLPDLAGYEYDQFNNLYPHPDNVDLIFSSRLANGDITDSTYYTAPGGGQVFDAGTNDWSWGLSRSEDKYYNSSLVKVTDNILDRFGQ